MGHLQRLMTIPTAIDTIWFRVLLLASPHWTSQISYETVASLIFRQFDSAVQMCLYPIAAEYNGPLEAAHCYSDDDRYDLVECSAAGQPTLDLSDRLRYCSIASMHASRLRSANVLVCYRRRV